MNFVTAGGLSVLSFMAIIVAICMVFVGAIGVVSERLEFSVNREVLKVTICLLLWLGLCTALTFSKILLHHPFPWALLYFVLVVVLTLWFSFSSYGNRLALGLSITALVAFHGFRLPLELVLHQWAAQGTIPETMTWTGKNWDIISGVFAVFFAPVMGRNKWLAWIFNIVGILLMSNVMIVAILSSPFPFGWDVSPKLLLVFYAPYYLIVPVCVGGALAGHVILTKALLYRR